MSDISLEPAAQESDHVTPSHSLKSYRGKAATVSLRQEKMRQHQAKLRESEAMWQEVIRLFYSHYKHQPRLIGNLIVVFSQRCSLIIALYGPVVIPDARVQAGNQSAVTKVL